MMMMMMMTMEVMMKMMITTKLHIYICIYNTFLAIFIGFGKTPEKKKKKKKSALVAKCHRARLRSLIHKHN